MNVTYNKNLIEHANQLRKNMTKEEKHLWFDFLKSLPVTFHRQKVIGKYIVDFYCASAKIVIELDGSQHYSEDHQIADHERDSYMKDLGLTVLRYTNMEIHTNFSGVCQDIAQNLHLGSLPLEGKGDRVSGG